MHSAHVKEMLQRSIWMNSIECFTVIVKHHLLFFSRLGLGFQWFTVSMSMTTQHESASCTKKMNALTQSTLNRKPQSPFTGYVTTCLSCNLTQKTLLQVALACIAQSAESRPKMKQVAEFFEQLQPSSWHTHWEYHVMCSSTISRFTVMMLMLNPCTMKEKAQLSSESITFCFHGHHRYPKDKHQEPGWLMWWMDITWRCWGTSPCLLLVDSN